VTSDGRRAAPLIGVILCADDFAMTEGVSAGIEELAEAGRLSAISALVTGQHWGAQARRLRRLRDRVAIGLHINMTWGSPLGAMPCLAPSGAFPSLGRLTGRAFAGRLDMPEIAAEVHRQLDAFETALRHAPDFVDGHQHVHILPGIRRAVLGTLARRFSGSGKPLLRDPSDKALAILARRVAVPKALALSLLSSGFGARARALGFPTNRGFSGVSTFNEAVPFEPELKRFFVKPGPLHLVMCHPGYPDAELEQLNGLVNRRRLELEVLLRSPGLPDRIWHPPRGADGSITWPMERT
jgi:predicted glycoside hydrolase/deacetylase ChbG (UPF0249 family)